MILLSGCGGGGGSMTRNIVNFYRNDLVSIFWPVHLHRLDVYGFFL